MTHIPGPWIASGRNVNHKGKEFPPYVYSENEIVARMKSIGPRAEAHARLIAAAPAMLAELQYVEACCPIEGNGTAYDEDEYISIVVTWKAVKDIRATIAKARGE